VQHAYRQARVSACQPLPPSPRVRFRFVPKGGAAKDGGSLADKVATELAKKGR
jgi:hypothetical protein